MKRPRLLFLAHRLPYPPDAGVAIRSYHLLRLLSERFDVTLLAFTRRPTSSETMPLSSRLDGLRPFAATAIAHPIAQEYGRLRWITDHLTSLLSGRAYTLASYASTPFRASLQTLLAGTRFDVVHVDSLDLAGYLGELRGLPVVCGHHNVESGLLRNRAAADHSRLRSSYLALQSRRLERLEQEWCPQVSLNLVVSEADRISLQALAPRSSIVVIPNGVDDEAFLPTPGPKAGIVFVGGTTWFPNLDALEYFASDIFPRITESMPETRVSWVGRASTAEQARFALRGIDLTGYVDDIRPYVQQAACFVVPLRVGGGTRLKILDAWAMGKAVVSTSVGCEGLDARDGDNILIRDDPAEFAAAVLRVLTDTGLQQHLGASARALVEVKYSWNAIRPSLLEPYLRLAERNPGREALSQEVPS